MMRRAALLLCLPVLIAFLSLPIQALEEEEIFDRFYEALPDGMEEELGRDPENAKELVGAEYLLSLFIDSLRGELSSSAAFFTRLLGMVLLLSLFDRLQTVLGDGTVRQALACGTGVILSVFLFRMVGTDIARAGETLQDMRAFSDGLIPVFGGLFAAGGSAGTAAASAGGFAAMSYLLEHVAAGFLLPLLRILFGFTLLFAAGGKTPLSGLFATMRQVYLTVLSLLCLLLGASLGFQSTLAASADSLAFHSVRFAVGNLIPVVGGSLGGSLRTLGATLGLLKSTVGALGVAALLLTLLPTLCGLLLHRLFLSLSSSLCSMLGNTRAAQILTDFRAVYDLAAATLALTSVLFLLILGILSRCALAVGG